MKPPPENSDCTSDYSQWFHCATNRSLPDDILTDAWDNSKNVSFVFHHRSAKQEVPPPVKSEKKSKKESKMFVDDDGGYSEAESEESSDEDYVE